MSTLLNILGLKNYYLEYLKDRKDLQSKIKSYYK